MSKSAPARLVSDDAIFRVETIPPPAGEDDHDSTTKVGDWALALEEKRLAATSSNATAKVNAFDLASALAKTARPSIPAPAPAPAIAAWREMDDPAPSGEVRRELPAIAGGVAEENDDWPWLQSGGLPPDCVVDEVTIDVADDAFKTGVAATLERPPVQRVKPRSLFIVGQGLVEVLIAVAVVVVSALMLAR